MRKIYICLQCDEELDGIPVAYEDGGGDDAFNFGRNWNQS